MTTPASFILETIFVLITPGTILVLVFLETNPVLIVEGDFRRDDETFLGVRKDDVTFLDVRPVSYTHLTLPTKRIV